MTISGSAYGAARMICRAGVFSLCMALAACGGGGGGDSSGGSSGGTPAPVLTQVSVPLTGNACGPVTMTLGGSNFTSASQAVWNGNALPTTFVSATQLTVAVPVSDLDASNSVDVTTAGATSASVTVTYSAPNASSSTDAVALQLNAAHSGYVDMGCVTLPSAPKWTAQLQGTPSYALIAGGMVFVTTQSTSGALLYALNQKDGSVAWGPLEVEASSAAYDNGQVFIGPAYYYDTDAAITAYNASNGQKNWTALLPSQWSFSSGITAANGTVYTAGAGDGGTLYAVDESSGLLKWEAGVANGDDSAPAVTATGVYVSYPCQSYDLAPSTGAIVWASNSGCDGGGGGTTVVANGMLYSPSGSGSADGGGIFNATSGSAQGTYAADVMPSFDTGNGYFLQSGTLNALAMSNGQVLWSFAGDGSLVTSPITVSSYVFIGSASGNLYAVDSTTGKQAWAYNVGSAFSKGVSWGSSAPYTGLSAGDGLLVVPSASGLVAFQLAPGG